MLKFYGNMSCPDCIEARDRLDEENIKYEYIDILGNIKNLKDFLTFRDNFSNIREKKIIGIPLFVTEMEDIFFDYRELIKNLS